MTECYQISHLFNASPKRIYEAWLSGSEKSLATGIKSTISPVESVPFTEVGGYVTGTNLQLEPYHKIVQSWRTTNFPTGCDDSLVEIVLSASHSGTLVAIEHKNLPTAYSAVCGHDWADHYFEPLSEYFSIGDRRFVSPE